MDIKNKKIVVLGLSRSGYAAALLGAKKKAKVFVSETLDNKEMRLKAEYLKSRGVQTELGGHSAKFFEGVDFFVTSPGIKSNSFALIWALKNNVPVFSEIEFASWFCPVPIVAITGSNGKTTVTTLLGKIFKAASKRVVVCGNIGNPFSGEFPIIEKADVVVLEVSSFQLEHIQSFCPKVSIILNITQNHFDHHKDIKEYTHAKARIFSNQTNNDFAVFNFNDNRVRKLSGKTKAKVIYFSSLNRSKNICFNKSYAQAYLKKSLINVKSGDKDLLKFPISELKIKGMHNVENAMAAALAAKSLKVSSQTISAVLRSFNGLEHRCEKVAKYKGVSFINDSKSTTVDATLKALSMFEDKSVVLICGGRDKGSDFKIIRPWIDKKVCMLICIGEAKTKIAKELKGATSIKKAVDLQDALNIAKAMARESQTVLLSPMCASFDMFNSFNERGKVFKKLVKDLYKK